MRTPRSWLAAVLVVGLVACGGDDGATAPVTTRATTTPPPTTSTTVPPPPDLDALLDEQRSWYPAPGGLALVRVGEQAWWGASGAADLDGTALAEDTTFRIASITKPIVATLVMDAVEQGLLGLDDPVEPLLPGVLQPGAPVTVRMLLDHTSGVFNVDEGEPEADVATLTDPALTAEVAELTERLMAGEPAVASDRLLIAVAETHDRYFEPGQGYHYSNTGYQLAAMVLEQVTGQPLHELLRRRIVEPLGLEHTSLAPNDARSPDLRGYGTSVTDGSLVDVTDDLLAFGNGGNGGVVATAGDLLTIVQALAAGRLVDADAVEEMRRTTPQSGHIYGLGLATYRLTCGTFYGHEGGVNGTASIALVSEDGDAGVVVALNIRDGSDPRLPSLADTMLCPRVDAPA